MFGGLQRFSLIDYPKEIAAVVFTTGCNFRCPYCHNPELVYSLTDQIEEKEIINFLKPRQKKLTAVSITGGEPTIQKEKLILFIEKIKKMGFKVKLDTNGTNPEIIKNLINSKLIDYVAMDIKTSLKNYKIVVRTNADTKKIKKSIETILESNIEHEFRTTVVEGLIKERDISEILELIRDANLYCIQNFMPSKTLDPSFEKAKGFNQEKLGKLKKIAEKYVKKCIIR